MVWLEGYWLSRRGIWNFSGFFLFFFFGGNGICLYLGLWEVCEGVGFFSLCFFCVGYLVGGVIDVGRI